MLLLDEKNRDEIVKFCENAQGVSSQIGFSLIQIATILKQLPIQDTSAEIKNDC